TIAYPFDLVRLATSIRLAPDTAGHNRSAASTLVQGYEDGLAAPRPTVLDEEQTWMRDYVGGSNKQRRKFWDEVDHLPKCKRTPPKVDKGLLASLPKDTDGVRFATRTAGGGSLGRPRYVAIADWHGGHLVREAKAVVPSAWDWAHGTASKQSQFM